MILLDTETTALTAPQAAPLINQPYITELAAIKLNNQSLKEEARLEFMCSIPISIPKEAVKITGITDEMIHDKPPFVHYLKSLQEFFLGESTLVAHNCSYDRDCLLYELTRMGKVTQFPWPYRHVCTVEANLHIVGYRMNLGDLYKLASSGKEHSSAHRAMADVEALVTVVKWMRKEKRI